MQPTTPDLFTQGEKNRDEGIARTLASNATFYVKALYVLESTKFSRSYPQFTGEDMRSWLTSRGVEPKSPHAWGALARALTTAGRIKDTGRVKKMMDPSSHARRTPVWEWR